MTEASRGICISRLQLKLRCFSDVWATCVSGQWKVRRSGKGNCNCNCNGKLSPIWTSSCPCLPACLLPLWPCCTVTNSRRAKTFRLNAAGGCCHSHRCAGVKLTHIRVPWCGLRPRFYSKINAHARRLSACVCVCTYHFPQWRRVDSAKQETWRRRERERERKVSKHYKFKKKLEKSFN